MPTYELTLVAEFAAAHRIRLPDGSLEPIHGHNWRVEVFLDGDRLDRTGIVADFTQLEARLQEVVCGLHNADLNGLPAFAGREPTTELIARHIHDRYAPTLPSAVRVRKVRVWETARCAAAYVPDAGSRRGNALDLMKSAAIDDKLGAT